MVLASHYGRSGGVRTIGAGSGEGTWYVSLGCNEVTVPGVNGDAYLVWADDTPTITVGSADVTNAVTALGIYVVTFTDDGPVTIGGAAMVTHKATITYSECG